MYLLMKLVRGGYIVELLLLWNIRGRGGGVHQSKFKMTAHLGNFLWNKQVLIILFITKEMASGMIYYFFGAAIFSFALCFEFIQKQCHAAMTTGIEPNPIHQFVSSYFVICLS